jgi:DNA-binding response OmpR family regulator
VARISRQMGADAWMAKPVSMEELGKRIDQMLSTRQVT